MSNAKAHAFTAKMDADAKVRELEQKIANRDALIAELHEQIAGLQNRILELTDQATTIIAAAASEAQKDGATDAA